MSTDSGSTPMNGAGIGSPTTSRPIGVGLSITTGVGHLSRGLGFWIPGDEWAPAWVNWRYGDDYVGWAPLPPDELVESYEVQLAYWMFVPGRYMAAPRVRTYIVPVYRRTVLLRATRVVNRTVPVQGARLAVNPGISPAFVARVSGAPIATYRVRPRVFAATQGVTGAVQVRWDELRGAGGPRGVAGPGARPGVGTPRLGAVPVQRTNHGDTAERCSSGAAAARQARARPARPTPATRRSRRGAGNIDPATRITSANSCALAATRTAAPDATGAANGAQAASCAGPSAFGRTAKYSGAWPRRGCAAAGASRAHAAWRTAITTEHCAADSASDTAGSSASATKTSAATASTGTPAATTGPAHSAVVSGATATASAAASGGACAACGDSPRRRAASQEATAETRRETGGEKVAARNSMSRKGYGPPSRRPAGS